MTIDEMVAKVRLELEEPPCEGWEMTLAWVGADGTRLASARFFHDPRRYDWGNAPIPEADIVGLEAKVLALTIKEQRDGRVR